MRGFLFVFVFCLVPQAAFAVVPMYRLGETYQSEGENGKACLEGHTGFVLSNPTKSVLPARAAHDVLAEFRFQRI